jgi:RNA polymerase sigma factor (sigma-70 family)
MSAVLKLSMENASPSHDPESRRLVREAVDTYEMDLTRFAMSLLHDLGRARDVVQDTFLKLYQQDPEGMQPKLKWWLFMVCKNRALDVIKKEKRLIPAKDEDFRTLQSDEPTPDAMAEAAEDEKTASEKIRRMLGFLTQLPENQRNVLRLKFQSGLRYNEIAEALGLSSGNVGFLLHTGLKKLRALMDSGDAPAQLPETPAFTTENQIL